MNHPKSSLSPVDGEIAIKLLQGDVDRRRAEEQFFNTYVYFIKSGMRKYSLSEEEAFDAYSDAILSAVERLTDGSFQGRSSLKTYLYQIFSHKCVDLLRKKASNKNSVHQTQSIKDSIMNMSDAAKTIIQQLADKADWTALRQKLNELGKNCQKALLLWADGYNDQEIAIALEYNTADVAKTTRLRCLEKLRLLYKAR